jgi:hypothetical protein
LLWLLPVLDCLSVLFTSYWFCVIVLDIWYFVV